MIMNIIILETNHTLNKQTFVLTNLYKEKLYKEHNLTNSDIYLHKNENTRLSNY